MATPINVSVFENVFATTGRMSGVDRLAFFTGLIRWIFELVQMMMETVVTGSVPDGGVDDNDGIMMVQMEVELTRQGALHVGALQQLVVSSALSKTGPPQPGAPWHQIMHAAR